jgi:hypothetical protein
VKKNFKFFRIFCFEIGAQSSAIGLFNAETAPGTPVTEHGTVKPKLPSATRNLFEKRFLDFPKLLIRGFFLLLPSRPFALFAAQIKQPVNLGKFSLLTRTEKHINIFFYSSPLKIRMNAT